MVPPPMQRAYSSRQGLFVITDCCERLATGGIVEYLDEPPDGSMVTHWWLHVSFSRKDRIPTYEEMCEVKEIFVGAEKTAYHVFPPRSKHVNIHANCIHLWHCIDGDPLPEFSEMVPGLGRSI